MTLVIEFVQDEELGAAVEDCMRDYLDHFFPQIDLLRRARHSIVVDDRGGIEFRPSLGYRLLAAGANQDLPLPSEDELRHAIEACFLASGVEPDYLLRLEP